MPSQANHKIQMQKVEIYIYQRTYLSLYRGPEIWRIEMGILHHPWHKKVNILISKNCVYAITFDLLKWEVKDRDRNRRYTLKYKKGPVWDIFWLKIQKENNDNDKTLLIAQLHMELDNITFHPGRANKSHISHKLVVINSSYVTVIPFISLNQHHSRVSVFRLHCYRWRVHSSFCVYLGAIYHFVAENRMWFALLFIKNDAM